MSKLDLIHKLGSDVVAALHTAEEYDHYRDRQLERGTWTRNKDRKQHRAPIQPKAPKYRSQDIAGGKVTLTKVTEYTRGQQQPLTTTIYGRQTEQGTIHMELIMPYNADSMTPPLTPLARKLADRIKHFEFTKATGAAAMELRGWYTLPGAETDKWTHFSIPVKSTQEAAKDFVSILKRYL